MANICDVCGYKDCATMSVIHPGPDGILRCKMCRHRLMYGRYVHDETEEFKLFEKGDFTEEYKRILSEVPE